MPPTSALETMPARFTAVMMTVTLSSCCVRQSSPGQLRAESAEPHLSIVGGLRKPLRADWRGAPTPIRSATGLQIPKCSAIISANASLLGW